MLFLLIAFFSFFSCYGHADLRDGFIQQNSLTVFIGQSKFKDGAATSLTKTFTISQAGNYVLSADISFTGTSSSSEIIYINANNVNIDLNDKAMLLSSPTATAIDAFSIASGKKNITINQGTINGMSGNGINIGNNCLEIHLNDLYINACNKQGILFNGSVGNAINNCTVSHCTISQCNGGGTLTGTGIKLSYANHCLLENCIIKSCNGTTSTKSAYGVYVDTSLNSSFINCESSGHTGNYIGCGFYITGVSNAAYFKQCIAKSNTSGGSDSNSKAYGFYATGTNNLIFEQCEGSDQQAYQTSAGFYLQNCSRCRFDQCTASGNRISSGTTGAYGFIMDTATNSSNIMRDCTAFAQSGSSSSSSEAVGFSFANSKFSILLRCNAYANDGGTGIGTGIDLLTTCTRCLVKDCTVISNTTTSGSTAYGIRDRGSGTTNLLIDNFSFANKDEGGAGTNRNYSVQYSTTNVIQEIGKTGISTITTPAHTNISVTP